MRETCTSGSVGAPGRASSFSKASWNEHSVHILFFEKSPNIFGFRANFNDFKIDSNFKSG